MGWKPRDPSSVETMADWRPFFLVAREMREEGVPWTLDPLDFRLIGRIERSGRPPLTLYAHVRTGGELSVDPDGVPHQVTIDRAGRIRTKPIELCAAIARTGAPQDELSREPRHHGGCRDAAECDRCQAWFDEQDAAWFQEQEAKREARRARRAAKAERPALQLVPNPPTPVVESS